MRQTFSYILPPDIQAILHPDPRQHQRGGGGGGRRETGDPTGQLEKLTFDKHSVKEIKCSRKFSKDVIQKQGLFLPNVPKLMLDEENEECCIYLSTGICNPNCARSKAHVPPTGEHKAAILEYKKGCLGRYNANTNKPANRQNFC